MAFPRLVSPVLLGGLALGAASPDLRGGSAEPAEGILVRDLSVQLRPHPDFGTFRLRGRLVPADGSAAATLDLPARAIDWTVGPPEEHFPLRIPAGDPRWTEDRRGRWTWTTGREGNPPITLRWDPEDGAFDLSFDRFPVYTGSGFWREQSIVVCNPVLDGTLAGRAWVAIRPRGPRTRQSWRGEEAVETLEIDASPRHHAFPKGGDARLFRVVVAEAGRYRVRVLASGPWRARCTLAPAAEMDAYTPFPGRSTGTIGDEGTWDVSLLPGEFVLEVEVRSGEPTRFTIGVSRIELPWGLEVNGWAAWGTWATDLALYYVDVTEAGPHAVHVAWSGGSGSDRFALAIYGPGEGTPLLAQAEEDDGWIDLPVDLLPGRHLVAMTQKVTGSRVTWDLWVTK